MLTYQSLERIASAAVLSRAYGIVRRSVCLWKRTCTHQDHMSILEACVTSSRDNDTNYQSRLCFDKVSGKVTSYACTCPAARLYIGPCKHVIALGIDFLVTPQAWETQDVQSGSTTSSDIAQFLDRRRRAIQMVPHGTSEPPGSVSLELTLVLGYKLYARFRLLGPRGAYVIKRIDDFISLIDTGAYWSYDKKLAFVHNRSAFDLASWRVAQFLKRCVMNRSMYAVAYTSKNYRNYNNKIATGRDLMLSDPEADELLGLFKEHKLYCLCQPMDWYRYMSGFLMRTTTGSKQYAKDAYARSLKNGSLLLNVVDGIPKLGLDIVSAEKDAYELVRTCDNMLIFSTESHSYIIQKGTLYCCPEQMMLIKDFFMNVYCSSEKHLVIAAQDAPIFAATTLPTLKDTFELTVPESLMMLSPLPCKLLFYLDRTPTEITVVALASYGDKKYNIFAPQSDANGVLMRDVASESAGKHLITEFFARREAESVVPSEDVLHKANPANPANPDASVPAWVIPASAADAIAKLIFRGLAQMREVGDVYTTPAFDRLILRSRPRVRIGAQIAGNLISLQISADDLPLDELYALLGSYNHRKNYHRLRSGSFLDLTGLDLDEVSCVVAELGLTARQLAQGRVEMPSYKAFLLENMLSDDEKDESFERWIKDFHSLDPKKL